MEHERGEIEFNALAAPGIWAGRSERSPLWKNVLAGLATATAAIWA